MGQYDMDWDAVLQDAADNSTNAAIPASDYDIEIIKAEATTFSSGSTGIKLTARVTTGPHTDRWLFDNLVMKEGQARNISVKNMKAIGVDTDWLRTASPSLDVVADRMVGLTCVATVGTKVYQGEDRNEIKSYKRASGATPPAPAPAPAQAAPSAEVPPPPAGQPAPPVAAGGEQPPAQPF